MTSEIVAAQPEHTSAQAGLEPAIRDDTNLPPSPHKLVIEAGHAEQQYWRDIWAYRELLYFLAWRDIIVRYKQTVIGLAWGIIRPLVTMVVGVVLQRMLKIPFQVAAPVAIVMYAAVLPWQFFADAINATSVSLIQSGSMITKIYFPRLILPAGKTVVAAVDFLISMGVLGILMAWYGYVPGWQIVLLPACLLLAMAAALGPGLGMAALNVKYRDFQYIVPFAVQFGVYVSPIFFPSTIVPERWRMIYFLNPMAGVIEVFRWAILRGESPVYLPGLAVSIGMIALLLSVGLWYFRKTEQTFADII